MGVKNRKDASIISIRQFVPRNIFITGLDSDVFHFAQCCKCTSNASKYLEKKEKNFSLVNHIKVNFNETNTMLKIEQELGSFRLYSNAFFYMFLPTRGLNAINNISTNIM